MAMIPRRIVILALAVGALIGSTIGYCDTHLKAQAKYSKLHKPMDIKIGQRIIAILDDNNSTLTIIPTGSDSLWVCAPIENARSCKDAGSVLDYLMREGEKTNTHFIKHERIYHERID